MPDFMRAKRNKRNYIFEFGFHLFDLISYEFLYLLSPSRKDLYFNSGYLPISNDFVYSPRYASENHAAMMYHFVAKSHIDNPNFHPKSILDVGCGQGGGLLYAQKIYPEISLNGTERALAAIRLARKNLGQLNRVDIRRAQNSKFWADNTKFDLIIGVGTPTYIGPGNFVRKAGSYLSAGGYLSISGGYRQGDHALIKAELVAASKDSGLELVRYTDIAEHTFAALKADIPRREAALQKLPKILRSYGYRWADMPGSPEYEEYGKGLRADFAAVFRKPS